MKTPYQHVLDHLDELQGQRAFVLVMHQKRHRFGEQKPTCLECTREWPCPTVQALGAYDAPDMEGA